MSAHESMEQADQAKEASSENKKIALLIAVIALCLALSETLGKGAQTESISKNVEASNLWAFFQAKSIRHTAVQTAAEQTKLGLGGFTDEAAKAAAQDSAVTIAGQTVIAQGATRCDGMMFSRCQPRGCAWR